MAEKNPLPLGGVAVLGPVIVLALAFAALPDHGSGRAPAVAAPPGRPASPVSGGARFEYSRAAMGSQARIVLHASDEGSARAAADAAFARIAALERAWSDWDESSELRSLELEAKPGEWREVSAELALGLGSALRLATETSGAFNPTVGPLTRLWREARAAGTLPSAAAIAAARERVGLANIELDHGRSRVRFRRAGIALDLGGIGKGLAADEALALLAARGFPRALVALGGDIAAGEPPPGRAGWTIGIGDPERGVEVETVALARAAISTSGDAEQRIVVDGVRLSHIIDPARGRPLEEQPEITVLAPNGATSDAWATALSVRPELAETLREREGFRVWIRGAPARAGE